jgi:PST family polysaccharide transporter
MKILEKIREIIDTEEKQKLSKNIISLSVLQFFELLLPFLIIPYLILTVGVEKFGIISFATVLAYCFQIIVDYGFNTTATRDISIHSDCRNIVQDIYNKVLSTKIVLLFISFVLFLFVILILTFFSKEYSSNFIFFLSFFGTILGQSFSPTWFFQGLQEVKYLIRFNFIGKFLYAMLIFVFVKQESDYVLVPILTSSGLILSAFLSLIFIKRKYNYIFKLQSIQVIKKEISLGKYLFLSDVKIALITQANILMLGVQSGNQSVAYYVGAEKIIRSFSTIQAPILNAIFPVFSKKINVDRHTAFKHILNFIKIGTIFLIGICTFLFIFSDLIIITILNERMFESILVFKILLLIPIMSFLDVMLGKHILLNFNKEKQFFKVFFIAAIINFPIAFFLISVYGHIGTAISQSFIQVFIVLVMLYYVSILKREIE